MSDQTQEKSRLVKLSDAVEIVATVTSGGYRPCASTIYRWATRGVSGIYLQILWAGDGMRTSQLWIEEFFASVTQKKCLVEICEVPRGISGTSDDEMTGEVLSRETAESTPRIRRRIVRKSQCKGA